MAFRRLASVLLAAVFIFSLAACSGNENSDVETGKESTSNSISEFGEWMDVLKDAENGKDDKTPYEMAVENGFEGTADEWFEAFESGDEAVSAVIASTGTDEFGNLTLTYKNGGEYTLRNRDIDSIDKDDLNTPTFVVEKVTSKRGDKRVEVKISVVNNPGIASILFDIGYDKTKIKLVDTAYNVNIIGGITSEFNSDARSDRLVWVNGMTDINGDFVFAKLFFEIEDDADGVIPMNINYDQENVYNANEEDVAFDIVNGEINIEK